ncbi:hypothetical protein CPB84DRAFT_1966158 [Gymnopilus junonius]|uniref:Uncharacterized protein n=1 Tax=Gymnopilus junonius TaxID=109634 RepID=A0A9P5NBW5_GYMJU|nr:hypothetical protein CPB84DRAFT_1966158 [Gymnopilus junonius]
MTEASDDLDAEMSSLGSDGDEQDADDEGDLPETIQGDDKLYYCTKWTAEIEDGFCFLCGEERQWLSDESTQSTVSIISQASHPDRSLIPRGDTPLREIDIDHLEGPLVNIAAHIRHYTAKKKGIYAWADDEMFSECSGSLMRPGDVWKVHLGRRISLDALSAFRCRFLFSLLEHNILQRFNLSSSPFLFLPTLRPPTLFVETFQQSGVPLAVFSIAIAFKKLPAQ